jgi:hypothetical protein
MTTVRLFLVSAIAASSLIACGGVSSTPVTTAAAPTVKATHIKPKRAPGVGTEVAMCNQGGTDEATCRSSYSDCAIDAKPKVEAYYNGRGATLDVVGMRYGKANYGSDGFTWQVAMTGCMAALQDEYQRLYGG